MSESTASLRRKIASSGDLQSVVRTMKALAASSIGQYEKSVLALGDYYRTVELGLGACLRQLGPGALRMERARGAGGTRMIGAVVFGSDQGLVGQFNEVVVDFAVRTLASRTGGVQLWAVGERAQVRLADAGLVPSQRFPVPSSVQAVAPLIGQILIQGEALHSQGRIDELHLFYNRPTPGAGYAPSSQRLLPFDESWLHGLIDVAWPTSNLAEVLGDVTATLRALTHDLLFISLFRACAESLASENTSRLAAMQRADKNIDELLQHLQESFHRLRQGGIDEELFDVVSG
ncbi:MAG: F0F1 ATP synthase subunit gamma, partial [Planctomycetota bacterium]